MTSLDVAQRALDQAQAEQTEEWEAEQEEIRRLYPDAQDDDRIVGMFSGFDHMTPAQQQEWIGEWRSAHPEQAWPQTRGESVTDFAAIALRQEREARARIAWERSLHSTMAAPPCQCCGQPGQLVKVEQHSTSVCSRCVPAVRAALADFVAAETVGDGRTRAQAAQALVARLLEEPEQHS